MARKNNGNGRRNPSDLSAIYGRVRAYTSALIRADQETLDQMTLYKGGAAGGGKQSNIASLRDAGVTHITGVVANRDMAVAFMAQDGSSDPTHCISFKMIDGGKKIRGDWRFMKIIA